RQPRPQRDRRDAGAELRRHRQGDRGDGLQRLPRPAVHPEARGRRVAGAGVPHLRRVSATCVRGPATVVAGTRTRDSIDGGGMADFDSPWKEALELYFPAFLLLFYPHIHADIDWPRGHEFLNKELQRLAPKGGRGRLYVDKLVKVWRKDGREAWVLIHVEVQTQRD